MALWHSKGCAQDEEEGEALIIMLTPSVKYWSSSPRLVGPSGPASTETQSHLVLMSVKIDAKPERTIQIAKCLSGAVSARIAIALEKFEKELQR